MLDPVEKRTVFRPSITVYLYISPFFVYICDVSFSLITNWSLGSTKDGKRWNAKEEHPTEEFRDLGKSKWSEDYEEDDNDQTDNLKGNVNVLSGILNAYGKEGKSVHWGDQVCNLNSVHFLYFLANCIPVLFEF